MGLRNLRELMQSFWLNLSKEISLMLSRITHKELKEEPWTEGTPGFSSQLFLVLCANLSISTPLSASVFSSEQRGE